MKIILFIIVFFTSVCKAQTDKTWHVCAGVVISSLASHCTYYIFTDERFGFSLGVGFVAGVGAGLAKENIYDASGRGVKDPFDTLATFHGTFIGTVGSTVSFDLHRKRKHKEIYKENYGDLY